MGASLRLLTLLSLSLTAWTAWAEPGPGTPTFSLCDIRRGLDPNARKSQVMPLYLFPLVLGPRADVAKHRRELVLDEARHVFMATYPLRRFATHLGDVPLPAEQVVKEKDLDPRSVLGRLGPAEAQQLACASYAFVPVLTRYHALSRRTTRQVEEHGAPPQAQGQGGKAQGGSPTPELAGTPLTWPQEDSVSETWEIRLELALYVYKVHPERLEHLKTLEVSVPAILDMMEDGVTSLRWELVRQVSAALGLEWNLDTIAANMAHITSLTAELTGCVFRQPPDTLDFGRLREGQVPPELGSCLAPRGTPGGQGAKARAALRVNELTRCLDHPPRDSEERYRCELRRRLEQAALGSQLATRRVDAFRLFAPVELAEDSLEMDLGSKEGVGLNDGFYLVRRSNVDDAEVLGFARVDRVGRNDTVPVRGAVRRSSLLLVYGEPGGDLSGVRFVEDARRGLSLELGGAWGAMKNPAAELFPTPGGRPRATRARAMAPSGSLGLHFDLSRSFGLRDFWETNTLDWYFADNLHTVALRLGVEKRFHLYRRLSLGLGAFGAAGDVSVGTGRLATTTTTTTTTDENTGETQTETEKKTSELWAHAWVFGAGGQAFLHYTLSPAVYLRLQAGYTHYLDPAKRFTSRGRVYERPGFSVSLSGPSVGLLLGFNP
jgi:hypothetical protein